MAFYKKDKRDKVNLVTENGVRSFFVHRVVAYAFCENPENLPEVDHILPICLGGNNHKDNLEWVTSEENFRRWNSIRHS